MGCFGGTDAGCDFLCEEMVVENYTNGEGIGDCCPSKDDFPEGSDSWELKCLIAAWSGGCWACANPQYYKCHGEDYCISHRHYQNGSKVTCTHDFFDYQSGNGQYGWHGH